MSVSGISSYTNALFQWQGQQLKGTTSGGSKSSSSSGLESLFGNTSMTSQLSSMIELTKYAMDAMGLASDSRVTFNQIAKYREQLQSEFSKGVKDGLAHMGISDITGLSFSLDKNGALNALGDNASDRKAAQAWLDANPTLGVELRNALTTAGIEPEEAVELRLGVGGKLSVVNSAAETIQAALDGETNLSADLRNALENMGVDVSKGLNFKFDDQGNLAVSGDLEQAETVNQWLTANPALADAVKTQLEKRNVDASAVTLRLSGEGNVRISVNNADLNDIQAVLDQQSAVGKNIRDGLDGLGVDPNINFSIQVNDDGSMTIISDHADRDKVQRFFDENPDLVKKYRQIETLSGIDDARKAMQLAPSDMRKRIQIESMSAWWANSGNANSYFGNYSDGNLSLLAGLNLSV
ncbi:hypothetical protein [Desulfovibrio sp. SGI.169]|uniref:hypothetical protein n=1 Tax=Desulfovibrio sp. SGI.169 TaxID=3420561 RepID=UPI003CFF7470